jgi:hypothetical protein
VPNLHPGAVLGAGLVLVALVRLAVPGVSPLFDGVVVADPYRYLAPPPGGDGSPSSAADAFEVVNGVSPSFAVFTDETPPQAELLAHGGELSIPAGSRSVKVTINPVAPAGGASSSGIAGNVYRFSVTDQAGNPLALLPGATITLALRGPAGIPADASIARLESGAWQPKATAPSGLPDFLLTNTTAFGDFVILASIPVTPSGRSPVLLIVALVVAAAVGLLAWRGEAMRRAAPKVAPRADRRRPRDRR